MTIRCKKCHGVVWIQPEQMHSRTAAVRCDSCGQSYVLEAWRKLRGPGRSLAAEARRVAREQQLDLPGAYSLLLGIMTAEELRELGDSGSTPCRTTRVRGPGAQNYDSAFQPAIDAGLLTQRQATERGTREAFAATLAMRHRLPRAVAYDVADNRISLLDAIRKRERGEQATLRVAVRDRRTARLGLLAGAILALSVVGALVARGSNAGDPIVVGRTRTIGTAELRADDRGRVVEVLAPDPRSVLEAFCSAEVGRRGRRRPLDVVPAAAPGARARLGLLRDPARPRELLAITILEDRASGHWRAGDGEHPLIATPAPAGAEQVAHRR